MIYIESVFLAIPGMRQHSRFRLSGFTRKEPNPLFRDYGLQFTGISHEYVFLDRIDSLISAAGERPMQCDGNVAFRFRLLGLITQTFTEQSHVSPSCLYLLHLHFSSVPGTRMNLFLKAQARIELELLVCRKAAQQ